jgi:hypothetical protein
MYGDSFIRSVDLTEISRIIKGMDSMSIGHLDLQAANELKSDLLETVGEPVLGLIFPFKIYFDRPSLAQSNNLERVTKISEIVERDYDLAERYATFCGATVEQSVHDPGVAIIVIHPSDRSRLAALRAVTAVKPVPVRIVAIEWINQCWKAKSRLAEDRPEFTLNE